jgi:hypothetical protein
MCTKCLLTVLLLIQYSDAEQYIGLQRTRLNQNEHKGFFDMAVSLNNGSIANAGAFGVLYPLFQNKLVLIPRFNKLQICEKDYVAYTTL